MGVRVAVRMRTVLFGAEFNPVLALSTGNAKSCVLVPANIENSNSSFCIIWV